MTRFPPTSPRSWSRRSCPRAARTERPARWPPLRRCGTIGADSPAGGGTVIRLLGSRLAQGLLLLALIAPLGASAQDETESGTGRLEPTYQPMPPPERQ